MDSWYHPRVVFGFLVIIVTLVVLEHSIYSIQQPFEIFICMHENCDISNWVALVLTVIITAIAVSVSFLLGKRTAKKLSDEFGEKINQGIGKWTSGSQYPFSGSTEDDVTSLPLEDLVNQMSSSSDQWFEE